MLTYSINFYANFTCSCFFHHIQKKKNNLYIKLYFYRESITKKYLYMYIEILYFMVNNELKYIRL